MKENFYTQTITEIKALISDEKLTEALNKTNAELGMPYIPAEYEVQLLKLQQEINAALNFGQEAQNGWNIQTVKSLLQGSSESMQLTAIDALKGFNARLLIAEIKEFLQNPLNTDENKVCLLFVLIDQQINEEFSITKKNGTFMINPATINLKELISKFEKTREKRLELINNNNPSLFIVCEFVLNRYFYSVFPNFGQEDQNSLIAAIWYKSSFAQGVEIEYNNIRQEIDVEEKEFTKMVDLLIAYKII